MNRSFAGAHRGVAAVSALICALLLAGPLAKANPTEPIYGLPHLCVRRDPGTVFLGGSCGPYTDRQITLANGHNTFVSNDMWQPPGAGHPQVLRVHSPGRWSVTSDQVHRRHKVWSYPHVSQSVSYPVGTAPTLGAFSALSSTYAETMPRGGFNEAAYDLWLGGTSGQSGAQEVMVWVDTHCHNCVPGKTVADRRFAKRIYTVKDWPAGRFHTVFFVLDQNRRHGSVNLLGMLRWAARKRLLDSTSLQELDFGFEIRGTGGRPATFRLRHFRLTSAFKSP